MQESWGTYSDRVSRLGWEGASERHMAWRAPWRHLDPVVVLAALGLALLGLAAIYSSTFASLREQGLAEATFARRQLLSLGGGLAGMVLVALVDYRRYQAYAVVVFGVVVLLLAAVLTPLGTATHGAQSWFGLGPLRLQPSEYAKVGMIVVLAAAFVNPSADHGGRGYTYNARQALIAIGSGGVTGKGYLKGTQTNLQYVPEQRTDFIFTVVGEELGFAGAVALLLAFAALLWRGVRIALIARDPFGSLLAAGVVAMLAFQAFVNVGMTIGIMPITGIPLPFVSYGGSSLIASFLGIGLLLNVHMRRYLQ